MSDDVTGWCSTSYYSRADISVARHPPSCHPKTMDVQVFGTHKHADVRKALRFFSERRVKVHFVDLKERAASKGELQRFAQKFGISALIDKDSKRYAELGLGVVRYDDNRWLEKLVEEPLVLRVPLVRWQHKVTIGLAETEWKSWIDGGRT
jgi:arsenate reductase (glutaredoxin)